MFTAGVEFGHGSTMFADNELAAAIVDHVVHHSRLVNFGDSSHELEESLMLGESGR